MCELEGRLTSDRIDVGGEQAMLDEQVGQGAGARGELTAPATPPSSWYASTVSTSSRRRSIVEVGPQRNDH